MRLDIVINVLSVQKLSISLLKNFIQIQESWNLLLLFEKIHWNFPDPTWMVKHLPTMQETQIWSLGWEDPLEKEMGAHSNALSWKIPWMEEPGRLQSMGSKRVRHGFTFILKDTLSWFFLFFFFWPHHTACGTSVNTEWTCSPAVEAKSLNP